MSSDTVSGNALQFTNDNKYCYAYSGGKAQTAAAGEVTLLEFTTNSEYLIVTAQFYLGDLSGDWWKNHVYFNNVLIFQEALYNASNYNQDSGVNHLIIPPFTTAKFTTLLAADADYTAVTVSGKVGMAQRVGNLNE
tara:strand:+ start:67 stop:474 length:408 start_codon:yes stop_codon:yes gene_type:complete